MARTALSPWRRSYRWAHLATDSDLRDSVATLHRLACYAVDSTICCAVPVVQTIMSTRAIPDFTGMHMFEVWKVCKVVLLALVQSTAVRAKPAGTAHPDTLSACQWHWDVTAAVHGG